MTTARTRLSAHRATYTLEMGVWRATCKVCGHTVADAVRRRAANTYRQHIRETNARALAAAAESVSPRLVDLTDRGLSPPDGPGIPRI